MRQKFQSAASRRFARLQEDKAIRVRNQKLKRKAKQPEETTPDQLMEEDMPTRLTCELCNEEFEIEEYESEEDYMCFGCFCLICPNCPPAPLGNHVLGDHSDDNYD